MQVFYNKQGRTADLTNTRKRFSSSQEGKPASSNVDSNRKDILKELVERKGDAFKLNSYAYAPTWKKESLLQQLNRSLSVKTGDKPEEMPKHMLVVEENEDYILEKNYFFTLIRKLPTQRLQRTEDNMGQFAKELPKLNFFFKGHSFLYICSLLKVGRIRFFEEGDVIYEKKMDSSDFSIILWGKVKLSDKKQSFKKISRRGQSLSEQILFTSRKTKQEKATALEQCYLLDLDLKAYHIFYEAMISNKLKAEVLMMEKNIKRNFIAKNSLRGTRIE